MAASSSGFATQLHFEITRLHISPLHTAVYGFQLSKRKTKRRILCCCSDSVVPIRRTTGSRKSEEKKNEGKCSRRVRVQATPALPFASSHCSRSRFISKQEKFSPRCTPRNSGPQSRHTPPKRDTGIANEKDWGINLLNEHVNESGTNEDGSTWYRESGEDLGENGYRCRWTRMGGRSHDDTSEWKETVYDHFGHNICKYEHNSCGSEANRKTFFKLMYIMENVNLLAKFILLIIDEKQPTLIQSMHSVTDWS